MKRSIKSKQRATRIMVAISAATDAALSGLDATEFTVVDTGTGVKTITMVNPFPANDYSVFCQSVTADTLSEVTLTSASSFVINSFDSTDGTTAKDALVHFMVIGSDSSRQ